MLSRRLLLPFVILVSHSVFAQRLGTGDVKIRVVFSDDRACATQAHVQLMSSASSTPVGETFTNMECMASFLNVSLGDYHIVVSGEGLQDADSGLFEVDARKGSQIVYITVKRVGEDDANAHSPGSPTVSAAALNIPQDAQKKFDKANALIAKENWPKAQEELNKAVAIYPQYAAAYNNLGVVEGRMGNATGEQEDLQKAIKLDEHFAPAYVNLGKFYVKRQDFSDAETSFSKAVSVGASDAPTLTLLANTQLLNKHFEQAITTCQNLHLGTQSAHAMCHYIAARAMEHENRIADARSELQAFLSEEPSGVRADRVRKELVSLQGH